MARVFKMREIKIIAKNEAGMLAKITKPISEARVNIGAFCAYVNGEDAEFLFITADNEKVKKLLDDAGFKNAEREVIVVETANEAGILFRSARRLSEAGVDLECSYSTAGNMGTTWIIFAAKEIDKAMKILT